jgi:hypothetical protein
MIVMQVVIGPERLLKTAFAAPIVIPLIGREKL